MIIPTPTRYSLYSAKTVHHLLNVGLMSLENASPELQLAVDLIYLLECNEIDPATALAALDIVRKDYQEKMQRAGVTSFYRPVGQ